MTRLHEHNVFRCKGGEGGVATAEAGDHEEFYIRLCGRAAAQQADEHADEQAAEDIGGQCGNRELLLVIAQYDQRSAIAQHAADPATYEYEE